MSLIADALRKAESTSPAAPPSPPGPGSLWTYRVILLGGIALVLVGLGVVTRRETHPTARDLPPTSGAPLHPKPAGIPLLRSAPADLALSGIIRGGDGKSLALINNEVVEEGGTFRGARVTRVTADEVDLEQEGRVRTLRLPRD